MTTQQAYLEQIHNKTYDIMKTTIERCILFLDETDYKCLDPIVAKRCYESDIEYLSSELKLIMIKLFK